MVDHATPWPNNFATGMLTRDLFAVANLLGELSSVKHAPQNHQHICHWQLLPPA